MQITRTWTLFLDRDGVINRRLPGDYVRRWEEFEFLEGVLEALPVLASCFGRVVIVTNQQGIGKGLMSEDDVAAIHRRMKGEIEKCGGRIDGIYTCPGLERDHPSCRKPEPALAHQAKSDFAEIDFHRSVMVGDSLSDMEFGARLAMVNVLIETKEETVRQVNAGESPFPIHYRFASLAAWTRFLEKWGFRLKMTG